ncbi:MAG: ADP-ribosylglycohydrolase family protein [Deferrisomatales bacterium]
MLGAIAGDVVGSVYERHPVKRTDFPLFSPGCRFTDDTVLTVATAEAIRTGTPYAQAYRSWTRRYPRAGYGGLFLQWALSDAPGPYGSFGNGSAMRVSPVGWAFEDLEGVLAEAEQSARATHDHPEGVKGAQAVAAAVFLARTGASKEELRRYVEARFGYDLSVPLARVRPAYGFDVTCQGSVPPALRAFLESEDFEGALRNAVSLGGDADTQACMAGAVAEAFYGGVPPAVRKEVLGRLDRDLKQAVAAFQEAFGPSRPG